MYDYRQYLAEKALHTETLYGTTPKKESLKVYAWKKRYGFTDLTQISGTICVDACYFHKRVYFDENGNLVNVIIIDNDE